MTYTPCKYYTADRYGQELDFSDAMHGNLIMFFQEPDNVLQALIATITGEVIYTHPTLVKIEGIGLNEFKLKVIGEIGKLGLKEFNDIKTIIQKL
jgi:hypothetical protein